MSKSSNQTQSLLLTNWARVVLSKRQSRAERRAFPQQIPGALADARTLPVRLVKGQRFVSVRSHVAVLLLLGAMMTLAACGTPLAH